MLWGLFCAYSMVCVLVCWGDLAVVCVLLIWVVVGLLDIGGFAFD